MLKDAYAGAVLRLSDMLDWGTGWLGGLAVLLGLTALAVLLHAAIGRLLLWAIPPRRVFLRGLTARAAGPSRLLFVVLLVAPAVPAAGFPARVSDVVVHLLLIAFVVAVGWSAIIATGLGTDIHLRRFRTDQTDNLLARKHLTQVTILRRAADTLIGLLTAASALMTIPAVREYGVSLFASAGAAGVVVGLAARPLLGNLIAGIQIAVTQPIRVDDAVLVEGEFGQIEAINSTYVIVKVWDERRLVVPLSFFLEKPFQNWTYSSAALLGTVFLYVDWTVPVAAVRARLEEVVRADPRWDGRVCVLHASDVTRDGLVELRALVSARSSGDAWDLRCAVREALLGWLAAAYPGALPRRRVTLDDPAPSRGAAS